jgi:hypothetical protein
VEAALARRDFSTEKFFWAGAGRSGKLGLYLID